MAKRLNNLTLPAAMILGAVFNGFFASLNAATPYLIFILLFITFCRISPRDFRFSGMIWRLLIIQILGGVAIFAALVTIEPVAAEGIMICVFAPTAVSSVVIGGMLGANLATMATFSFVSNLTVAFTAPVLLSFAGTQAGLPFIDSFLSILSRVGPLLIIPMSAALVLKYISPRLHSYIGRHQGVSFYIWSLALMIVVGRTVEFIIAQDSSDYFQEITIAAAAFAVCLIQFAVGRKIGGKYGDKVAGGQSLGQKNTVLAIWLAQSYLHPIASIGPASYVIWQNIVNSWQIWRIRDKRL